MVKPKKKKGSRLKNDFKLLPWIWPAWLAYPRQQNPWLNVILQATTTRTHFSLCLWSWSRFLLKNVNHFKADPWGTSNFADNVTTFRMVFRGPEHIFQCRNVSIYYEIRQFTSKIFESSNRRSEPTKLNSKNSKLCPPRTLEIRVSALMNSAQEK